MRPLGGRSAWLAVMVTTLVFFLTVIDVTAVNVAFPSIRDDLDVSSSTLSWMISAYNITVGALMLVAGRYADSWGRKRLFIPGVGVFLFGSMLSGIAVNVELLIASRVVQGIGGAIVSATALAVVLPDFPPNKRSTVIGLTGATAALGAVVGPGLGAFLTEVFSWRAIFWINVPASLLVLFLAPRLLHESKNPAATGKVDLAGIPIGAVGISLVMFAIVNTEKWGAADPRVFTPILVGLGFVWWLVARSRHHAEPLIELDLFHLRSFASTSVGVSLYAVAFTSGFLANSLLLQELWGQSLETTGAALMISPIIATIVSPVAGRWADRIGHRWILAIGSAICGVGYLLFLPLLDTTPTVWTRFVPTSMMIGFGVGATIATWASAGLADVPEARFGTANATIRTIQQVSYALGISVVVVILADVAITPRLGGFRWAWTFVGLAYLAAALVVAATFPAGSSTERATG